MNKIYLQITEYIPKFREQALRFTNDKNEVDEVVQETLLFFLQMNSETLKKIYTTDGIKGIVSYGCIMIKRSLTCKNNKYYYKIKKYYTRISSIYDQDLNSDDHKNIRKSLDNLPENLDQDNFIKLEKIDKALDQMYWYDREIFKLYYYEKNTLDSLAAKTKISRNSLFTTIKKVKTALKNSLNECKEK